MTTDVKLTLAEVECFEWEKIIRATDDVIQTYCAPESWLRVMSIHDFVISCHKKYGEKFTRISAQDIAEIITQSKSPSQELIDEVGKCLEIAAQVLVLLPDKGSKQLTLLPRNSTNKNAIHLFPILEVLIGDEQDEKRYEAALADFEKKHPEPPVKMNAAGNYVWNGQEFTEAEFLAKIRDCLDRIPGIEKVPGKEGAYRFMPDFNPNIGLKDLRGFK